MDNSVKGANFEQELSALLNKYSQDNRTNTPDWILAQFLSSCLDVWREATWERDAWFSNKKED